MHRSKAIVLTAILVLVLFGKTHAEDDGNRQFHLIGHDVLGWVPYSPMPIQSIPPIPLPNGGRSLDYPATVVNFTEPGGKKRFVLSIAADLEVDHRVLKLVARDAKDLPVLGVSFSVISVTGPQHQLITFHCAAKDVSEIRKLVLIFPKDKSL